MNERKEVKDGRRGQGDWGGCSGRGRKKREGKFKGE